MAWPSTSARTKTWGTEILTSGDLDGQFDILHQYNNDQLNGTTGHKHSGGTSDGSQIPLSTGVTGTLPIANGGTGLTTLAAILNLVYPVGSTYCNYNVATNPATLLGFGTWTALAGYCMYGVDGGANFTAGGTTGGELTHVLTVPEMPNHTHTITTYTSGGGSNGQVLHQNASPETILTSNGTGGGGAHNNLPPFVSVYMWYRSA